MTRNFIFNFQGQSNLGFNFFSISSTGKYLEVFLIKFLEILFLIFFRNFKTFWNLGWPQFFFIFIYGKISGDVFLISTFFWVKFDNFRNFFSIFHQSNLGTSIFFLFSNIWRRFFNLISRMKFDIFEILFSIFQGQSNLGWPQFFFNFI